MGMRVRMGPFSVSSRGRVGVNAGPVSFYGGGSRRRSSSGGGSLLAGLIALSLVFVVIMWPLSLWGHALHLTPSWHQLMNRDKAWMHEHYPLVGVRYVGAAVLLMCALAAISIPFRRAAAEQAAERQREAARARETWLAGPPPPLPLPARFTQGWIAENVPNLHPGQVPVLLDEMRARGWTDARIDQRVRPYLTMGYGARPQA
jgi:hypothetical protein